MARQGQPRPRTRENVNAFWSAEARTLGHTPEVTIRDLYFRLHELAVLLTLLPEVEGLLDAGCGTGFGTLILAGRSRRCLGIDCAPDMLAWAQRLVDDGAHRKAVYARVSAVGPQLAQYPERVAFRLADVTALELEGEVFDAITAQRLLINLATREDQEGALGRLRAHAAPDALLVLAESTEQGYAATDVLRRRFGLPPLERHWHNLPLDETSISRWPALGWAPESVLSFDTYALLSKVVNPAALGSDNCAFLSGANRAAAETAGLFRSRASASEIGLQALLAFYLERLRRYDPAAHDGVATWVSRHSASIPEWGGLGAHRVIIARAVPPCHAGPEAAARGPATSPPQVERGSDVGRGGEADTSS